MDKSPVICFGQQPCGFFPRRFLVAKITTARRVQKEIGGRLVFFYHDSDHDPRETLTIMRDRTTGAEERINFAFLNKTQKKFTPLYAKKIDPEWQSNTVRRLPRFVQSDELLHAFVAVKADNVADFCLAMYRAMGLLDGMEIIRSRDPVFRAAACPVDDFYVDVRHDNELVRARYSPGPGLRLHQGGDSYIDLPETSWSSAQVSPARDTRLRWMQSVIQCTHYVAGAGEMNYLDQRDAPEVQFVRRDEISESTMAYIP